MLLLAPYIPWLGFVVYLCAPLLFSGWLPSARWVSFSWPLSLPRLVGLFATVSSFAFHLLLSLAASSVPLFLLCSTLLFWVVLRSLGGLLCSFDLAPFSFLTRKLLFYCLRFPLLVFPVGLPRVFLSCTIAFLSSSRILLLCRGSLCALFFPPLYPFGDFVFFCVQWSFFLLYRFPVIFLALPFVSPWFRSFSSPASSSSSVPCRRVLLVCLQLRRRRRLGILLPCPLLWLLPLRLPSGFHLLLTFSGAVLLLTGFRWGLVVPTRRVF